MLYSTKGRIEEIRLSLELMTPEERLEVFEKIKEGYCDICGIGINFKFGNNCFCQNDE